MIEQLLLHGVGDYLIQNDWMGLTKKERGWKGEIACQLHCITYSLPFLLIASLQAVFVIYITHYIIDRTHIIDYFIAIKNNTKKITEFRLGRKNKYVYDISNFGFGKERPFAISIWLYIITDNVFHLLCNYFALKYL